MPKAFLTQDTNKSRTSCCSLVRTDERTVVGEGELAEACSMEETLSLEQLGC